MADRTFPAWAANAEARELIAQIIVEQPDTWMIRPNAWANCRTPKFKGEAARKLRAIHATAYTAAIDRFNAGEITRDDALDLIREDADMLIDRLLNEGIAPADVKALGDGRFEVAA